MHTSATSVPCVSVELEQRDTSAGAVNERSTHSNPGRVQVWSARSRMRAEIWSGASQRNTRISSGSVRGAGRAFLLSGRGIAAVDLPADPTSDANGKKVNELDLLVSVGLGSDANGIPRKVRRKGELDGNDMKRYIKADEKFDGNLGNELFFVRRKIRRKRSQILNIHFEYSYNIIS
ncbi:hypothetical protein PIB30_022099 [Stylosanthes scabra]|uniref:Uncharacterized protein n=1 Tax=Stylosanthes scabra TaxID=79078 RepID=A0ABU6S8J9_9FABA|nr:hypothetical protein [Stylosanthes scabra]